jgi:hypothetical protein
MAALAHRRPTAADTRALEHYAESARRDPRAQVDVHWES